MGKIILFLGLFLLAGSVFALPLNKDSWCTTNPSFKPGCLKYLANVRFITASIINEEARCNASLMASPIDCGGEE